MKVFRLSRKKYSKNLSGKGASFSSNRWNSKGTEIIYSAESRALALAEVAVHLTLATLPSDYVMIEIDIPDPIHVHVLNEKNLPLDWNMFPHLVDTQEIGDSFIQDLDYCVMKVPSAVVKGDFNFLINPFHKDFKKIKILHVSAFPIDGRMY